MTGNEFVRRRDLSNDRSQNVIGERSPCGLDEAGRREPPVWGRRQGIMRGGEGVETGAEEGQGYRSRRGSLCWQFSSGRDAQRELEACDTIRKICGGQEGRSRREKVKESEVCKRAGGKAGRGGFQGGHGSGEVSAAKHV